MRDLIGSKRDLADLLGLSERRLTELAKAGVIPARGPQGFDLTASVRGYIAFLKSDPGTLRTERTRYAKIKADLLELQFKFRTGELVDRRAVDSLLFTGNRRVRDNFLNLPARTDALVAVESDRQKCFDILTLEVRQILEGLTDGLQEDRDADSHAESRPLAGGRGAVPGTHSRGLGRHRGQTRGGEGL